MISLLVNCDGVDGCGREFRIAGFEVEKLDNSIEKTYFKCPHCDKEYIAFYTDKATREKQKEMRELQAKYNKSKKEKVLKNMQKLQKTIKEDMDSLKSKMIN